MYYYIKQWSFAWLSLKTGMRSLIIIGGRIAWVLTVFQELFVCACAHRHMPHVIISAPQKVQFKAPALKLGLGLGVHLCRTSCRISTLLMHRFLKYLIKHNRGLTLNLQGAFQLAHRVHFESFFFSGAHCYSTF